MGYHDDREIPNYWAYARQFVLQDHLFEPVASWSLPSHMFLVSAWAATCTDPTKPMSCTGSLEPEQAAKTTTPTYGWTDLTYLLGQHGVSWASYLDQGNESQGGVPDI